MGTGSGTGAGPATENDVNTRKLLGKTPGKPRGKNEKGTGTASAVHTSRFSCLFSSRFCSHRVGSGFPPVFLSPCRRRALCSCFSSNRFLSCSFFQSFHRGAYTSSFCFDPSSSAFSLCAPRSRGKTCTTTSALPSGARKQVFFLFWSLSPA